MKAALCPSGWGREMKLLHSSTAVSLGIAPEEGACPPENRYVGLIELSFNPTSFFLLTSPRRLILH